MQRILSPSILSADFGRLERDIRMLNESAAAWIHLDVMDGCFVPNISFGFPVVKAVRRLTQKMLDVHLMIVEPERYVQRFVEAGADAVTVHLEATEDLGGCLRTIRGAGAKAGISIKPGTPLERLEPWLGEADLVLVMSVEPGFGGQAYIPGSTQRVAELRRMVDARGLATLIEVDGGISAANAGEVYAAGADAVVAGNAVFGAADPRAEIDRILGA